MHFAVHYLESLADKLRGCLGASPTPVRASHNDADSVIRFWSHTCWQPGAFVGFSEQPLEMQPLIWEEHSQAVRQETLVAALRTQLGSENFVLVNRGQFPFGLMQFILLFRE